MILFSDVKLAAERSTFGGDGSGFDREADGESENVSLYSVKERLTAPSVR